MPVGTSLASGICRALREHFPNGKGGKGRGKTVGKPWGNRGKTVGKPWGNRGETVGKPWGLLDGGMAGWRDGVIVPHGRVGGLGGWLGSERRMGGWGTGVAHGPEQMDSSSIILLSGFHQNGVVSHITASYAPFLVHWDGDHGGGGGGGGGGVGGCGTVAAPTHRPGEGSAGHPVVGTFGRKGDIQHPASCSHCQTKQPCARARVLGVWV